RKNHSAFRSAYSLHWAAHTSRAAASAVVTAPVPSGAAGNAVSATRQHPAGADRDGRICTTVRPAQAGWTNATPPTATPSTTRPVATSSTATRFRTMTPPSAAHLVGRPERRAARHKGAAGNTLGVDRSITRPPGLSHTPRGGRGGAVKT